MQKINRIFSLFFIMHIYYMKASQSITSELQPTIIQVGEPTTCLMFDDNNLFSVSTKGTYRWDISVELPRQKFFGAHFENKKMGKTLCIKSNDKNKLIIMDLDENGQWDQQKTSDKRSNLYFRQVISKKSTPLGQAVAFVPDRYYGKGIAYSHCRPCHGDSGIQFCGIDLFTSGGFLPIKLDDQEDYATSLVCPYNGRDKCYQIGAGFKSGIMRLIDTVNGTIITSYDTHADGYKKPILQTAVQEGIVATLYNDTSIGEFDFVSKTAWKTINIGSPCSVKTTEMIPLTDGKTFVVAINGQLTTFDIHNPYAFKNRILPSVSSITALACTGQKLGLGINMNDGTNQIWIVDIDKI